jgi:hypothetical protein
MDLQTLLMSSWSILVAWAVVLLTRTNRAVEKVSDALILLVAELKRVEVLPEEVQIDEPYDEEYDEPNEDSLMSYSQTGGQNSLKGGKN